MRQHNLRILFFLLVLWGAAAACSRREARFRIGVSQCSEDEWRCQMNSEILREAGFYEDVEVDIRTAHDDNDRQAEDIRGLMDEGVDLLIVAPNEAAPITPVVEEAYNRGIPVIVVDRKILSDKYTAYVGADNYEIGKAVGEYVANVLHGQGDVVEISGLVGSTPAVDRHQGFVKAISACPGIRLLAAEDGAWLQRKAGEKMDTLLNRFPHIDLVYAQNDRMATGAYAAAARKGREKEMRFIGIDALPGKDYGVEKVLAGELDATFIYPTGGDRVMQIAMDILNKRDFPRETILGTSVVNRDNAPIMKMQTAHIDALDGKIETLNGKINRYLARYATQQVVLYGSLSALLLLVGLLVAVYLSLRAKNRLNRELSMQKKKLEEQKEQLMQQKDQLIQQKDLLEVQKNQLEVQKEQLEQLSKELEEATHAKLVFFTNVSHDFRTPLTLIADPIEQLLADRSVSDQSRRLLELMKKNVHILLRLVNQILDFRKVENGRMELHLEPFDLLGSFRGWNDSFRMALLKKHIAFNFEVAADGFKSSADTDFRMMADAEKMERIYFNLFSNAVKYTPENGKITIRLLKTAEQNYSLSVFNSGSYISSADVEAIFERFYQVGGHQAGTGIGLALVHAFVEMHGGNITAGSDEKGTTFTVTFPQQDVSQYHSTIVTLPAEEKEVSSTLIDTEVSLDEVGKNREEVSDIEVEGEAADADCPTVLVIDDNADIRSYVKSLLSNEFRVLDAADGAEGIRLAMKYVPDVVISDVMMPGMDGVECCRRLKGELQTCHIPVILLTACSLDEQRIQGYDGGADSYISKPFNSQLLLSRVRNLIANRCRLRQFFGDNRTIEKESISDLDKDFVSRFKSLVEERMKDAELNVEDLGRNMGMSRVQLYRKLKSLTNYSPNELLRRMRLKKAASLLASSDMTIAEIAYEVGFSSPSYFTKCYKEQFGESPTEFLKRRG